MSAERCVPVVDSLRRLYLRASGVSVLLRSSAPLPCRRETRMERCGCGEDALATGSPVTHRLCMGRGQREEVDEVHVLHF